MKHDETHPFLQALEAAANAARDAEDRAAMGVEITYPNGECPFGTCSVWGIHTHEIGRDGFPIIAAQSSASPPPFPANETVRDGYPADAYVVVKATSPHRRFSPRNLAIVLGVLADIGFCMWAAFTFYPWRDEASTGERWAAVPLGAMTVALAQIGIGLLAYGLFTFIFPRAER